MLILLSIGSTAGDLGQTVGGTPQGKPLIDHRTQLFEVNEYAFQCIEKVGFGITKLSILAFYRRIFVGRTFNAVSWAMIALVVVWMVSFFFSTIFECVPPSLAWSKDRADLLDRCIKTVTMLLAFAWTDIITDVMILCLPIPMISQLQMPLSRKFALYDIFLLGALTVLAGVARLVFFYRAAADHHGADVAVNTAPTIYWSLVEASMAIVSATLPTLRPLFRGFSPESILGSIRSRISLQSMGRGESGGSNDSKGSKGSKAGKTNKSTRSTYVKHTKDTDGEESQIELHGIEGNRTETAITGDPGHMEEGVLRENDDHIFVSKSITQGIEET